MKVNRSLCLLLTVTLIIALLPASVHATVTQTMCHYDANVKLSPNSIIGFGGHQWNLIGNDNGGVAGESNAMTLLSKDSLGATQFNNSTDNNYNGSLLKTALNNLLTGSGSTFSAREQSKMIAHDLTDVGVTGQKLWPLSSTEIGSATFTNYPALLNAGYSWWLRTPYTFTGGPIPLPCVYFVRSDGATGNYDSPAKTGYCMRPATIVSTSDVLYLSDAVGGKSGTIGQLTKASLPSGAFKLNFIDRDTSFLSLASSATSLTCMQGTSVTIPFSGAKTASNKYVSCVIENSSNSVQYYGKLSQAASGNAVCDIPADLPIGTYTLCLFNEEINGDNQSDFLSDPLNITLEVKRHDAFVVTGGVAGYTYTGGLLTFTQPGDYTVSMGNGITSTTADKIVVNASASTAENPVHITLNNVDIDRSASGTCALDIQGSSAVSLTLSSGNKLTSGMSYAGLQVPLNATLVIGGTGSLTAKGGDGNVSNGGAGIGGSNKSTNGKITIDSGTITATGGISAAGIGAGGDGGTVIINGGTVTATGGYAGAGIGGGCFGDGNQSGLSGDCGNVTITGGMVTAIGGNYGAGIGNGVSENPTTNDGNVTITGGTVVATGGTGGDPDAIYGGAGIGGGFQSAGVPVYISGGSVLAKGGVGAENIGKGQGGPSSGTLMNKAGGVNVCLTTVALKNVSAVTAVTSLTTNAGYAYGSNTMKTDAGGKLYLYLSNGTKTTMATVGAVRYTGSVVTSTDPIVSQGTLSRATYTIAAAPNYTTYGSVTGTGSYPDGTTVTLKAIPKAGYRFVRWLEGTTAVSTAAEYKFVAVKSRTLKAEFAKIGAPTAKAVSGGYNSVKLSWSAVTGAKEYVVYRATSSGGTYASIGTSTSTGFTNAGLSTGKTYYYKVKAKCVAGSISTYGGNSAVVSAKPVPARPTGVKAASASYTSIKLTWTPVAGATKYVIYRATSGSGTYVKVTETTSAGYLNTGRTTGKTYYYKIRAYRLMGTTKVYGGYAAAVHAKAVPATPTVTLSKPSPTSIKVSWSAVSGATKYQIYRATMPKGATAYGSYVRVCTASSSARSWIDSGNTIGASYKYVVRAYHLEGTTYVYGSYSTTRYLKL